MSYHTSTDVYADLGTKATEAILKVANACESSLDFIVADVATFCESSATCLGDIGIKFIKYDTVSKSWELLGESPLFGEFENLAIMVNPKGMKMLKEHATHEHTTLYTDQSQAAAYMFINILGKIHKELANL